MWEFDYGSRSAVLGYVNTQMHTSTLFGSHGGCHTNRCPFGPGSFVRSGERLMQLSGECNANGDVLHRWDELYGECGLL